jgi:hypothetical protein
MYFKHLMNTIYNDLISPARMTLGKIACLVLLSTAIGCGSSNPNLVPVSGKITLNGGPLPAEGQGNVTFVPVQAGGNTATGMIDSSGNYRMSTYETGDGVAPGEYKVTILWATQAGGDEKTGMLKPPSSLISDRYSNAETSGLTAKVDSSNRKFDFDLQP